MPPAMCFLHPAFDFTFLIKVKSTLEDSLIKAVDQSVFSNAQIYNSKASLSTLNTFGVERGMQLSFLALCFCFIFVFFVFVFVFVCFGVFFGWGGALLFRCFAQPESICVTCQRAPCANLAMQPFCRYQTVEDCSGVKNLLDHSVLTRCMVILTTVVRSVIGFDWCWNCNQINKIGFSKLTCNIKMT